MRLEYGRRASRRQLLPVATACAILLTLDCSAADFAVPDWAYPSNGASVSAPASASEDIALLHVPDSQARFTRAQVTDLFAPPDWHPDAHPPMPSIVANGRRPSVYACGYCHLPDGQGRPENAPLAGLPAAYIVEQVAAIRAGTRRSAWDGKHAPTDLMRTAAENVTDAELVEAAEYFSKLRLTRRVTVVETERAPVSGMAGWMHVAVAGGATEPLGDRLLEMAVDQERHELRDSASGYIAYVPPGSIARGEQLVLRGSNGPATSCTTCHGGDLRGVGVIPPLAGRSPTYILRQLLAFRTGARSTVAGQPMQPVANGMSVQDMIAVAAYAASVAP